MNEYYSELENFINNPCQDKNKFYELNKEDKCIYNNILEYPSVKNILPSGNPFSIGYIDESNFVFNMDCVSHVKVPRNMRVNNGETVQVFDLKIYSKQSYYKQNDFNRKKFTEILFNKAGVDIKKTFFNNNYSFNYWTKPSRLTAHLHAINPRINQVAATKIVEKNHEFILSKIIERISEGVDFHEIAADYIFNKSNFYYNNIINLFTRSIDQILKHKGLKINVDFFRYMLESAFVYNNKDNFGIIYQTIKYMKKQSLYSETSITNTIRKLEFLGCISYIVGDAPHQQDAVAEYLEKIKLSHNENSESMFNHYKRVYGLPLSNKFSYLLFPVFNFHVMINYVLDHFAEQLIKDASREIVNHIIKTQSEMLIEKLNSDELVDIFRGLEINIPLNDKLIKGKPRTSIHYDKFNLFQGYEKYRPFIREETMSGYPIVNITSAESFFIERSFKSYHTQTLIEDCYFLSDWVKILYKNNYHQVTGEYLSNINISTYNIDDDFVNNLGKEFRENEKFMSFLEPTMDHIGLLQNMMNYYYKGMWLFYIFKKNGGKTLDNNMLRNLKSDLNLNNFQISGELINSINYRFLSIVKKNSLGREKIFSYTIPLFGLIKNIYPKINNKKEFIYVLYKSFTNSSKSPLLYLIKLYKFLTWIETDLNGKGGKIENSKIQ